MTKVLDVNMDAVVVFSNKLEKLNKTAFPKAVATALNSAAFDVKQNTMLKSSKKAFIERQRNFFRANSRVEMAKGMNVNNMQSIVGFRDLGGSNFAVDNLEQQEYGGKINGKSFIPLDAARAGRSYKKKVTKRNRIGKSSRQPIVSSRRAKGVNPGQRFIKSVHFVGRGGFVLSEQGILWRVNSLKRTRSGSLKLTAIYDYKKGRKVNVKAKGFMRKASIESGEKLEEYFIKAAKTQFNKALK